MFEKNVLRRAEKGPALTAGELAEALLFYQNVHLVLDYGSLSSLITHIGMPTLVSLLSRQNISAVYCENSLGTQTETRNNVTSHCFVALSLAGNQEVGPIKSRRKLLEHILIAKHGYEKKHAKRLVDRFRQKVSFRDLTSSHFIDGGILQAAHQDLHNDSFINEATRLIIEELVGHENVPRNFIFKAHPNNQGFHIETDLSFPNINRMIRLRKKHDSNLTPAHIMNNILNARADTILASYYGGEFYTSSLTSKIIRVNHSELLRRVGIERNELKEFSEIVIGDGPSLREVINSKERSFEEFLKLLDSSQRFKNWAGGISPDVKLVKEYWNAVSSESWIDRLPSKTLRYVIGNVVGVIEPITGQALSFADSFLIDKIARGWRPSHFVDQKLNPFLSNDDS